MPVHVLVFVPVFVLVPVLMFVPVLVPVPVPVLEVNSRRLKVSAFTD
ncbi:MAG: hypothetical protein GY862_12550 [Gammaproteobacteria bacterium]|nr:hypothetical protein [Gammaproteobacteria bacterium]